MPGAGSLARSRPDPDRGDLLPERRIQKGLEYARKALDYVMYDPAANYVYGILSRRLDNLMDAKEALGWAARSMEFRSSAYSELGSIYIDGGQPRTRRRVSEALARIRRQQRAHPAGARHGLPAPEAAAMAREALAKILDIDPLNHLAHFEQYLLEPCPAGLQPIPIDDPQRTAARDLSRNRSILPNLRQDADAARVLAAAPEQATVRYWQPTCCARNRRRRAARAGEGVVALALSRLPVPRRVDSRFRVGAVVRAR